MFNKDAIEALQYGGGIKEAESAILSAFQSDHVVSLPNHFALHDLEKYLSNRRRARGTMETSEVESFVQYVSAHEEDGAMVFINDKAMVANAVLNLGTQGSPGHADNRAQFRPAVTAAYEAMRNIAKGIPLTQTAVAEFLEDWASAAGIQCFHENDTLPIAKAISAVRNITIEGMRKVEASEQQLSASKSAFEQVTASSKDTLPTLIYFKCVPYHGFEERQFVLRLGILTTDKPAVVLRVVNAELHAEEMAKEMVNMVAAELSNIASSAQVLIGDYAAKT